MSIPAGHPRWSNSVYRPVKPEQGLQKGFTYSGGTYSKSFPMSIREVWPKDKFLFNAVELPAHTLYSPGSDYDAPGACRGFQRGVSVSLTQLSK